MLEIFVEILIIIYVIVMLWFILAVIYINIFNVGKCNDEDFNIFMIYKTKYITFCFLELSEKKQYYYILPAFSTEEKDTFCIQWLSYSTTLKLRYL